MKWLKFNFLFLILSLSLTSQFCLAQDYIVGVGDVLTISVYDHPDLGITSRVDGDGSISINLIGEVKVEGLSPSEISEKLTILLADGYIVNPQITVFIKEFRSNKAIVMGQVMRPGLYELHGRTSFFELLSKAGGLTKEAGDRATIKRKKAAPDREEEIIVINLKNLREKDDGFNDIIVGGGDSIYVEKVGVYYVTGEVKRPDVYRYEENINVIKAITKAGGLSDIAAQNNIKIIRKDNGEEKVFENVSMDETILPEDVIVVPESLF